MIAAYGGCNSVGKPFLEPNGAVDPMVARAFARFDMWLVAPTPVVDLEPEILATVADFAPLQKRVAYCNISTWPSSYPQRTYFGDMRRAADRLKCEIPGDPQPNWDITKPGVVDAFLEIMDSWVFSRFEWAGLYVDCLIDYPPVPGIDRGAWRAAWERLADGLHRLAVTRPGFILMGNGGNPRCGSWWFHSWMLENWPYLHGGLATLLDFWSRYKGPLINFTTAAQPDPKALRFGLGCALLVDGYHCMQPGMGVDGAAWWNWTFPEYDRARALGSPLGIWRWTRNGYRRDFERGSVVVDPANQDATW
jgi:hypothetical protein